MAMTAGILLALYALLIVAMTRTGPTESSTSNSTARGCRFWLLTPVLVAAALLICGQALAIRWMTVTAFWLSLTPFYLMVLGWVSEWRRGRGTKAVADVDRS
ncbi:MAG: hypothetical protein ACAI43_07490 [Phycisphaerae bacterium]